MEKTNAMRILDQKKIKYEVFSYPHEEGVCVEGSKVAELLNQDSNLVFKTLVCISNTKRYYVCCIPVNKEIDLKKAAKALNVKSLEMIHVKELLPLTGYVRGGCSPIGMKKSFVTIMNDSALSYDYIYFSGGKIGLQIKMDPKDLSKVINLTYSNIVSY